MFMSYLQYQTSPMHLNPECVVRPSVQRQPPPGRVPWLCEPSSAYCLSYRENTTDKESKVEIIGKEWSSKHTFKWYIVTLAQNFDLILTTWSSSSADLQLLRFCSSSGVNTPSFFMVWTTDWVFLARVLKKHTRTDCIQWKHTQWWYICTHKYMKHNHTKMIQSRPQSLCTSTI